MKQLKGKVGYHIILILFGLIWLQNDQIYAQNLDSLETVKKDSLSLVEPTYEPYEPSRQSTFQPEDRHSDPLSVTPSSTPLLLKDPSQVDIEISVDTTVHYTIYEKMGDMDYKPPTTLTFEEFSRIKHQEILKSYWKERAEGLDGQSAVSGRRLVPKIYINPAFDKIFGGSFIDIQPSGFITLDFGARWQRINNPALPIRQQKNGAPKFDLHMSTNIIGKVGEKLQVTANFDNKNSFDFENNIKVEYNGFEEDIIKKIELGNVSMPVSNSLITGAQSLFGVKTQLQFGKLFVTAVASTQQGKTDVIEIEGGGAQAREFEIRGSNYDENKHFFLGHFFRENYEAWLNRIPQVISGVNVTRVEVYLFNRNNDTETLRNYVSFSDLGESENAVNTPTSNDIEELLLYSAIKANSQVRDVNEAIGILESEFNLANGSDFERVTSARKLKDSEYSFHSGLGYISLVRPLRDDEVLGVSYQYTYNGEVYTVGEMAEDYSKRSDDEVIYLKMLRPGGGPKPYLRTWDLMMKNIYRLNASQIGREGFDLRVIYNDDRTGQYNPSLHEGKQTKDIPLIELLKLDRLNRNNDPQRDGNFDFVEGITIDVNNGLLIFPTTEPFGSTLASYFDEDEQALVSKYVYDTLYRTTKADAELYTTLNKFYIRGKVQGGNTSEITLPGINVAEGSVVVMAGGQPLAEGTDYTVDYTLGRVTIINPAITNSGKKISISYESQDLFSFQSRSLVGGHFDYRFSDHFNVGTTLLHLNERPGGTTRFSTGNEPTSNTKWGANLNYQKESRTLTKLVDAIPLIQTKANSSISFSGEFAQLIPGTSNKINGESTAYIDDFENAVTPFSLGTFDAWKLAATPQTSDNQYDKSIESGELGYGYKRAKIAWYQVDRSVFYTNTGGNRPSNINDNDLKNHFSREVSTQEVFPNRPPKIGANLEPVFDISYFPTERGQFNYNPNLTNAGLLTGPANENWGGISRAITSDVDFDKSNIEYIEFWMMDPFMESAEGHNAIIDGVSNAPNTTGGEFVINLGDISEDITPDGRHGFENGLPIDNAKTSDKVSQSEWGYVTQSPYLNNAFDNEPSARPNQDVGFDGLKNEDEASFFSDFVSQAPAAAQDPSADNFTYFLGEQLDQNNAKIIERYKNFNGSDGNTPINTGSGVVPVGSTYPDNEDLNKDNTISSLEQYYEYKVQIKKDQMQVGQNYIVDRVINTINGDDVSWYLFRIPVREYTDKFNNIEGFKSIRFIRTYLTGFTQPIVLRMVKFQLVGNQWRKYLDDLSDADFDEAQEQYDAGFVVSVVNIEENGQSTENTIPYRIPPGINRDFDQTSPIERQLNEQSLQLCVNDLKDGDAKAVYKNINLDLVNYGRIKMFLHAQSNNANDDELTGFIRLGNDFENNYYEIEVPLKITPNSASTAEEIWPAENEIDLALNELYSLKSLKNVSGNIKESKKVGRYTITVVGQPVLNAVQTMMIGIRNPKNDAAPKSVCIWSNELRLTDFDSNAGWATNARASAQLADFANINGSIRHSAFGFGGIQQRISERSREQRTSYDISANINLDKIFIERAGIKLPMYVSYEQERAVPQYDPRSPDIPLVAALNAIEDPVERAEYKEIVTEKIERKSINFSNVRKVKVKEDAKSHIYDIENLSLTAAYSETNQTNLNLHTFENRMYKAGLGYNYSPGNLTLEPFKNSKKVNSPYLKLLKDFNLSPLPSSLSFRGDLDRTFRKTVYRNDELTDVGVTPNFEKLFLFNRVYDVRWAISKGLAFDYYARANATIDEPDGDINTTEKRDTVISNLQNFGRLKQFDQNAGLNYKLPLDKIPFTDWLNADMRYAVGYSWTAGALDLVDQFGNTIQNNREISSSGKIDMVKLYNKVKFLNEINSPKRRRPSKLGRNSLGRTAADTTKVPRENKGLKKGVRFLMMLRNINANYSQREGTLLPGFAKNAFLFGMDSSFAAPGWDFILGDQNPDIRYRAAENNWLSASDSLTTPFNQSKTINLGINATVEPITDLRIRVDLRKTKTEGYQEIFRYDMDANDFASFTPSRNGSYSVSNFWSIQTFFIPDKPDNTSTLFEQYKVNRSIINERLSSANPNEGNYDNNSQDVLIPAFIAAYSGIPAENINLTPFPKIPLPNWRVDYAGLGKIPALSKTFSSINITHNYTNNYSVGGYTSSLNYNTGDLLLSQNIENYPYPTLVGDDQTFIPLYVMGQVSINEQFAPLVGINLRTKSNMNIKVEYKTSRNVGLNVTNAQVTEMKSQDIVLDFGLTKAGMKLPFRYQGRTISFKNDMTLRMSFLIRDTKTVQRILDKEDVVTNGLLNIQFRPTINYVINQRINIMFYFERSINEPQISSSFRRATTAVGTQIRFNLAQ